MALKTCRLTMRYGENSGLVRATDGLIAIRDGAFADDNRLASAASAGTAGTAGAVYNGRG
jgi:hypothetical protein